MVHWRYIPFACLLLAACGPNNRVPGSLEEAGETVWVEGGRFEMGNPDAPDAIPVISQEIDGLEVQRYEVTHAQFKAFADQTGYLTLAEKTAVPTYLMPMHPPIPWAYPVPLVELYRGSQLAIPERQKINHSNKRLESCNPYRL